MTITTSPTTVKNSKYRLDNKLGIIPGKVTHGNFYGYLKLWVI
jgi:hypothetical protein